MRAHAIARTRREDDEARNSNILFLCRLAFASVGFRPCLGRDWFDAEQRAFVLVCEHIEETVRALPHIADPLLQIGQQVLLKNHAVRVQDDALEERASHAPDEDVALPPWKLVARVERQT